MGASRTPLATNAVIISGCVPAGAALGLLLSVIIPARAGAGHSCPSFSPASGPIPRYSCQYPPDQAAHVVHWLIAGTICGLVAAFAVWCDRHQ
jgi:hypothetical protein